MSILTLNEKFRFNVVIHAPYTFSVYAHERDIQFV